MVYASASLADDSDTPRDRGSAARLTALVHDHLRRWGTPLNNGERKFEQDKWLPGLFSKFLPVI
jgi:hypothetical protein